MFSFESWPIILRFTDFCRVFAIRSLSFIESIRATAMKHGSCIHLEE